MKAIAAFVLLLLPAFAWAFTRQGGQGGELAPISGPLPAPDAAPDLPAFVLPEPSFLESIGITLMAATRGERNNNPGNLRIAPINWQGKIAGTDPAFETFADARSGIRALAINLRTYQTRYGLSSIRQIVTRYAPASENDTGAYVRAVAASMSVGPDAPLDLSDMATLTALVTAIIKHENGRISYSAAEIADAVGAA